MEQKTTEYTKEEIKSKLAQIFEEAKKSKDYDPEYVESVKEVEDRLRDLGYYE